MTIMIIAIVNVVIEAVAAAIIVVAITAAEAAAGPWRTRAYTHRRQTAGVRK